MDNALLERLTYLISAEQRQHPGDWRHLPTQEELRLLARGSQRQVNVESLMMTVAMEYAQPMRRIAVLERLLGDELGELAKHSSPLSSVGLRDGRRGNASLAPRSLRRP